MWLILCDPKDEAALWAYQGLKNRRLAPLELVEAETLTHGVRWEHRLGVEGVYIDITLSDGRRIRNEAIRGAINRLLYVPTACSILSSPFDNDYVAHEVTSFFISWLYALRQPVLNRPTPRGLSGYARHVSEWIWLASQAGLPTPEYIYSDNNAGDMGIESRLVPCGTPVTTVFVIEGYVVGASVPHDLRKGCLRFAKLSKTALLGIEFVVGPEGTWTFVGATPFPDLRLGGEALLDVLALVLKSEVETNR